ncbi:MAG: hypothetical protein ACTTI4_08710 [Prevotella fusca]|uniref:hypothetical protein n=1 Tax=Prevotella fusca TaxID=589436 RepID=UPI003F9F1408
MDWIEFLKDWGGLVLSALGIIGGVFAYLQHDRKLKSQEKRLNDLQIRQLQKAETKELQANIKCNAYKSKSNAFVKIVNSGPADASNVRVEILDKDNLDGLIFFHDEWGPYDLINASNSVEERIALCEGHDEFIKLKIIWDDAFSKDRETILNVQIP